MQITALVSVAFDAEAFDDAACVAIGEAIAVVAQTIRHRALSAGVSIGAVNASLHAPDGAALARLPLSAPAPTPDSPHAPPGPR